MFTNRLPRRRGQGAFDNQLQRWEGRADLETWGRKTGTCVGSAAELTAALDRELAEPGRMREIRRAACADIYYNVGCATDAGMAALYRIVGLVAGA